MSNWVRARRVWSFRNMGLRVSIGVLGEIVALCIYFRRDVGLSSRCSYLSLLAFYLLYIFAACCSAPGSDSTLTVWSDGSLGARQRGLGLTVSYRCDTGEHAGVNPWFTAIDYSCT